MGKLLIDIDPQGAAEAVNESEKHPGADPQFFYKNPEEKPLQPPVTAAEEYATESPYHEASVKEDIPWWNLWENSAALFNGTMNRIMDDTMKREATTAVSQFVDVERFRALTPQEEAQKQAHIETVMQQRQEQPEFFGVGKFADVAGSLYNSVFQMTGVRYNAPTTDPSQPANTSLDWEAPGWLDKPITTALTYSSLGSATAMASGALSAKAAGIPLAEGAAAAGVAALPAVAVGALFGGLMTAQSQSQAQFEMQRDLWEAKKKGRTLSPEERNSIEKAYETQANVDMILNSLPFFSVSSAATAASKAGSSVLVSTALGKKYLPEALRKLESEAIQNTLNSGAVNAIAQATKSPVGKVAQGMTRTAVDLGMNGIAMSYAEQHRRYFVNAIMEGKSPEMADSLAIERVTSGDALKEALNAGLEAAKAAPAMFTIFGGIGGVGKLGADAAIVRTKFGEDMLSKAKELRHRQIWAQFDKVVDKFKLNEPSTIERVWNKVLGKNNMDMNHVYVRPNVFEAYFAAKGIPTEEGIRNLLGDEFLPQYRSNKESNADIVIPSGKWAANVAASKNAHLKAFMNQHFRTDPAHQTISEMMSVQEQDQAFLKEAKPQMDAVLKIEDPLKQAQAFHALPIPQHLYSEFLRMLPEESRVFAERAKFSASNAFTPKWQYSDQKDLVKAVWIDRYQELQGLVPEGYTKRKYGANENHLAQIDKTIKENLPIPEELDGSIKNVDGTAAAKPSSKKGLARPEMTVGGLDKTATPFEGSATIADVSKTPATNIGEKQTLAHMFNQAKQKWVAGVPEHVIREFDAQRSKYHNVAERETNRALADMDGDKTYSLWSMLTKGKTPSGEHVSQAPKLSRASVEAILGPDHGLPDEMFNSKRGVTAEQVAHDLGYPDPYTMLLDLQQKGDPKVAAAAIGHSIAIQTVQREHPTSYFPEHKSSGVPTQDKVDPFSMNIKEVNVEGVETAIGKAREDMSEAAQKGDQRAYEDAETREANLVQMHAEHSKAKKTIAETDAKFRYAMSPEGKAVLSKAGDVYVKQAERLDALREGRSPSPGAEADLVTIGNESGVAIKLTPFDSTVGAHHALGKELDRLMFAASSKHVINYGGKTVSKEAFKKELHAQLVKNGFEMGDNLPTPNVKKTKKKALDTMEDRHTPAVIRKLLNFNEDHVLGEVFLKGLDDYRTKHAVTQGEFIKDWHNVLATLPSDEIANLSTSKYKKSILGLPEPMTLEERLGVAMLSGSEAGLAAVKKTRNLNDRQVQSILDTLDPHHVKFLESYFKMTDPKSKVWQAAVNTEKTTAGSKPLPKTARDITIKGKTIKGGYHPISYSDNVWVNRQMTPEQAMDNRLGVDSTRMLAGDSYLQMASGEGNRPVRLDLNLVAEHLKMVANDVSGREFFINVSKLTSDPEIAAMLERGGGEGTLLNLQHFLEDAHSQGSPKVRFNQYDNLIQHMATAAVASKIAFNFNSTLTQFTGIPTSWFLDGKVNPGMAARQVKLSAQWIAPMLHDGDIAPLVNAYKIMAEADPVLSERLARGYDLTMREVDSWLEDKNDGKGNLLLRGYKNTKHHALNAGVRYAIGYTQAISDTLIWHSAYEQKFEKTGNREAALEYARGAVERSQGSGDRIMQAETLRDKKGFRGMFNRLFSPQSAQANEWLHSMDRLAAMKRQGIMDTKTAVGAVIAFFGMGWIPSVLYMADKGQLTQGPFDDEKKNTALNIAVAPADMHYLLRNVKDAAVKIDTDLPTQWMMAQFASDLLPATAQPALRAVKGGVAAVKLTMQGDSGEEEGVIRLDGSEEPDAQLQYRDIKNLWEAGSYFGLPTSFLGRLNSYGVAVDRGDAPARGFLPELQWDYPPIKWEAGQKGAQKKKPEDVPEEGTIVLEE